MLDTAVSLVFVKNLPNYVAVHVHLKSWHCTEADSCKICTSSWAWLMIKIIIGTFSAIVIVITSVSIYGAVIMAQPLQEHPFIWWMQTVLGGRRPLNETCRLGLWSAYRMMFSTCTVVIYHYYTKGWYSYWHSMKDGRLSHCRHCGRGSPHPRHSGCHDKHNCLWRDSSLAFLTVQSGMILLDN